MTKVKLNGQEYNLAMNWKAAIRFERETKKNALDIHNFDGGSLESIFQLGFAMVAANNPTAQIPDFDAFLDMIGNGEEDAQFINAIVKEYQDFILPKPGDQQPEAAEPQESKEPKKS